MSFSRLHNGGHHLQSNCATMFRVKTVFKQEAKGRLHIVRRIFSRFPFKFTVFQCSLFCVTTSWSVGAILVLLFTLIYAVRHRYLIHVLYLVQIP